MEWLAVLLVVASAVLHAGWNLLGKMQATPSLHFFIMATFMASSVLSLGLVFTWHTLIKLPFIPLILLSGCFQVLYLSGLAKSYQHFELSVAYPIIRALPVIFVPLAGVGLSWIGSYAFDLNINQWIAYGVIILGTLLLMPNRVNFSFSHSKFIILAALGTTGYSITDHYIQRQWGQVISHSPFTLGYLYILLQGWATVLVGMIYLMFNRQCTQDTFKLNWKIWLQAGLVISGSYFLILVAMVFVPNASDIVAFRQISIPIGFLLGVTLMNEKANKKKLLSISTICLGLMLMI